MRRRGGLPSNQSLRELADELEQSLAQVESRFHEAHGQDISELVAAFLRREVGLSTMVMYNASKGSPSGSCTCVRANDAAFESGELQKYSFDRFNAGVGVGYDLTDVSDLGTFMPRLNHALATINVPLLEDSRRPVAAMATISDTHPDIDAFLALDRSGTPLITRSLWITREMIQGHEGLELTGNLGLIRQVAESIHDSGNPGILFRKRFDDANPTPEAPFVSTAPCGEVALAPNDFCHIGYISLPSFVSSSGLFDFERLDHVVRLLTRGLDDCVELSCGTYLPSTRLPVPRYRRISIGSTGYADALKLLGFRYGSPESLHFASSVAEAIDYSSKVESVQLARDRGPFPGFAKSRYTDASWLPSQRIGRRPYAPRNDWAALADAIACEGIRNATTTAMPSAETASAYLGVNPTLEPHEYRIPNRKSRVTTTDELNVMAVFQPWLDGAISKTLTVSSKTTAEKIASLLFEAYDLGLKGISIFRSAHG